MDLQGVSLARVRLESIGVEGIAKKIEAAGRILLTTHRQCDGDGLGSQLALYHGLKKLGKDVRALNVDKPPKKYEFLDTPKYLECFDQPHAPIEATDLALVFDTNDFRLIEPLYSELKVKCKEILFIDHHPVLNDGPSPTSGSFINTRAASTGEITFFILKQLAIPLDEKIARALYTSIVFDTQLFRFIRNSPNSHLICAELLSHEKEPGSVHRHLFSNHTPQKISFLAKTLASIEYFENETIATLTVSYRDLVKYNLSWDDTRDVIDLLMNIEHLQAAALFREEQDNTYKLSLRSRGNIDVLSVAEVFGGGGHLHASGATLGKDLQSLKASVVQHLKDQLYPHGTTTRARSNK